MCIALNYIPLTRASLMTTLGYKAPRNMSGLQQEEEAGLVATVNERQNGQPLLDDSLVILLAANLTYFLVLCIRVWS